MLPQTAEYALRSIVWLASRAKEPQTSAEIAAGTKVPPRYLYKVLQALVRGGLIASQPGPRGGYTLLRDAAGTSILDVVNAVGAIQRIRQCPLGIDQHENLCPLHRELDAMYASMEQSLCRVTIDQLLREPVTPLCAVPRVMVSPPVVPGP